jgi:hypothetical protein
VIVPRALAHLLLVALVACGGARSAQVRKGAVLAAESAPDHAAAAPAASDAPLDEASARFLLASRFRAAGLRVVEDVSLQVGDVELVVDGFDPVRRVGFEYVAAEEREVELDSARRLADAPSLRILVVDAASADEIERSADAFLRALTAP